MARSGVKKSNFIGSQSVPSGSTFDYVYNGQNYKITDADLFGQFGVSGTIQQEGDPLATPILNKSGTVNNIRNIENGSGIQASVSINGGCEIAHNFAPVLSGVPIMPNPTDASPTIRSFSAGAGINLSVENDIITVESTSVPTSSKTVTVSTLADLPEAVGGAITLNADTEYRFLTDIDFGTSRIILQDDSLLRGASSALTKLTYTGSNPFITGIDVRSSITALEFECLSSDFISFNDTTSTKQIALRDLVINSNSFGSMTGSLLPTTGTIARGLLVRFSGVTGMAVSGSFGAMVFSECLFSASAGHAVDLGSSTSRSVLFDAIQASVEAPYAALSGLTNSGNIVSTGFGVVSRSIAIGTGSGLNNISTDDSLWLFRSNQSLLDSHPDGLLSLQGNTTNTVITAVNTPVIVAGTWVVESASMSTGTASGRVTYNGARDVRWPLSVAVTIEPVSGGSTDLSVYFAINGSVIPNSKRSASASSGNPVSITGFWQETFSTGGYVEIFVENNSNTTDLLVSSSILQVN